MMSTLKRSIAFSVIALSSSTAFGSEEFARDTKIAWTVQLSRDGEPKKLYSEGEIDQLLKQGISHDLLKLRCQLRLEREHIRFDPKSDKGYTRDEERVESTCLVDESELKLKTVRCARGYGKKNVGSVFGDAAEIQIKKGDSTFFLNIGCVLK